MNEILSGFTRKYILRENYIPSSFESPRLAVGLDLNWHWSVKDDYLYVDIAKNFKKLVAEPFKLYSADQDFLNEMQPIWDLGEEGQEGECSPEFSDWIKDPDRYSRLTEWRKEHLAYYVPAHNCKVDEYGIHLKKRGIARLAVEVHQLCHGEPIEIIQLASVYKLFAHEICHAWIEDICCLIDFNQGEKLAENDRRYAITNKIFNSYIFMEEAICNTAAYGFLHNFLHCKVTKNNMPMFNPCNIMHAFEQWMRKQPKGYCDFYPITDAPYKSSLFIRNILKLLVRVYRVDPWSHPELFGIVGDLFGCHCSLAQNGQFIINFKENNSALSLWGDEPPLHVEY